MESTIKNPNPQVVPKDLAALPQWGAWKGVQNGNDKLRKIPINPKTGKNAKTNDPETWGTIDEARRCFEEHGLEGIGFVFTKDDPFVGIDLDMCRDPETGETNAQAWKIVTDAICLQETQNRNSQQSGPSGFLLGRAIFQPLALSY